MASPKTGVEKHNAKKWKDGDETFARKCDSPSYQKKKNIGIYLN